MITKETAARIWKCYNEIEKGQNLLADMEESLKKDEDPNPRDPFGRKRPLELGVPMGNDSHRCFDVEPKLAMSIIRAHIANKQAELFEVNEQARIEVDIKAV